MTIPTCLPHSPITEAPLAPAIIPLATALTNSFGQSSTTVPSTTIRLEVPQPRKVTTVLAHGLHTLTAVSRFALRGEVAQPWKAITFSGRRLINGADIDRGAVTSWWLCVAWPLADLPDLDRLGAQCVSAVLEVRGWWAA